VKAGLKPTKKRRKRYYIQAEIGKRGKKDEGRERVKKRQSSLGGEKEHCKVQSQV